MHQIEPYKKLTDHIRRPMFGSDRDRDRFHSAYRSARETQPFRIAVAPMTALDVVRDGKAVLLRAGEEVMSSDMVAGTTVGVSLQRLVEHCAVVERDLPVPPPRAA